MTALAGALLVAASLALPPEPRLTLLDVPFLSQSEALCGGAAAAMVLRYWGEAATPEDFAPLVDRAAGGIATASLERAVRARGWTAVATSGDASLARAELTAGRPVIALIEDRPGAFHYVVVVGWHERAVVLHDPARTPYVLMRPAEFERRWATTGRWMLAIAPQSNSQLSTPNSQIARPKYQTRAVEAESAVAGGQSPACETLVAEGVAHAQRNELGEAERLLAGAAYRCSGAAPMRELAGVRLLQRRWPEVEELAGRAVAIDPGDAHAWRLLATGRYVTGDRAGALEAWNHAGEPRLDLVTASGLQRTAHRVVERRLGLSPGTILTRGAFDRADRRLDELPAAFAARLEYVARAGGRADVRAHVAERPPVPSGVLSWAAVAVRAAGSRDVEVGLASLAGGGERLDLRWRFWPHRPGAGAALRVPLAAGILSVETAGERQPFTEAALPAAERIGARASIADWASGIVRWELRGGVDRWTGQGTFGLAGGGIRLTRGRAAASFSGDVWIGGRSFGATSVGAAWRSSAELRGPVVIAAGGIEWLHGAAPLDLWPGADTGHARSALLRAHPILDEGRLRVERLGRRLAHATSEAQYWFRAGPLPVGAAIFVDAAQISRRRTGAPLTDVDAGAGIRLALPGRSGVLRIDAARGLRDGGHAVSVAWSP